VPISRKRGAPSNSRASGSPVSALAWRGDGKVLAFGTEEGKAGLLAL